MSRAYTTEEVRTMFLEHIAAIVHWWDRETRATTSREKLEGLAFSIMCALDGCSVGLPAFAIIPLPASEDKSYCIENDENWFPEITELSDVEKNDIGGGLHEVLHKYMDPHRT